MKTGIIGLDGKPLEQTEVKIDRFAELEQEALKAEALRDAEEYEQKSIRAMKAHELEMKKVGAFAQGARNRREKRVAQKRAKALVKKINRTLRRYT